MTELVTTHTDGVHDAVFALGVCGDSGVGLHDGQPHDQVRKEWTMSDDRLARAEAALAQVRALAEDWAEYQGSHIHQVHARRLFAVLDAVK